MTQRGSRRNGAIQLPAGEQSGRVVILLLAAGRATRMGEDGSHKLLAEFDGIPLVRRSALMALKSQAASLTVVTGHRRWDIKSALTGMDAAIVYNPHYLSGMASSLIAGFSAPEVMEANGVMVMLADMPRITAPDIDSLIAAFRASGGRSIVRAVSCRRRGNPVVLPRSLKPAVLRLEGDVGARHIIKGARADVVDVDIGEAAHLDVDTPDDVIAAGGILKA